VVKKPDFKITVILKNILADIAVINSEFFCMKRLIPTACVLAFCLAASLESFAQPGSTIELKKPPKYENRELRILITIIMRTWNLPR
jgi:hypothetical protein